MAVRKNSRKRERRRSERTDAHLSMRVEGTPDDGEPTHIVTESQKQQIRTIQEKYAKQIADLQAQIDAATKQCDTEIESLLNADQKAKTKKAREELAARAKKAAEEKKGPTKSKATTFSGYANSLLDRQ